ncbi:cation transporter [Oceanispirochaeta crateris]|uniref:Cation transporter n=1 Tax=Oceanispirochaeta crateris TaxID=2518645 RepID=A0A5C1QKE5_9SPIO|nr:cation diffusion facilitator family transporter [Oceanispirochaeta crateris]QEN08071.1 cation transporter [Oceanispirochaeta crateris]
MKQDARIQIIRRTSWIGIIGNGFLALLKIILGLFSGSIAVVADGIDSSADIVTSLITLFTANIINEPPDKEHPWGHARAETIATKALSFFIFFAGAQLFISTIQNLLTNELRQLPGKWALVAAGISIIGKILLALNKYNAGKITKSSMLIADAKNMQNDIILSLTVLIGLGCTYYFNLPLIDMLTGLFISLWIMKTAYSLFMETSIELMDSVSDDTLYSTVFKAATETPGVINPHRARIRKLNNLYDIDLDIEVCGTISVREAHGIAVKVEENIKKALPEIFDIMVHVEPEGNIESGEQFGLTPEDF